MNPKFDIVNLDASNMFTAIYIHTQDPGTPE